MVLSAHEMRHISSTHGFDGRVKAAVKPILEEAAEAACMGETFIIYEEGGFSRPCNDGVLWNPTVFQQAIINYLKVLGYRTSIVYRWHDDQKEVWTSSALEVGW